jgi:[ribosomal protein S5]-alanine N-acetyltransferase
MTVILETPRLVLRTWTAEDDAADALEIWGDAEVMRFVGEPFADIEAARRALRRAVAAQEEHGVCIWPVVEKSGGKVVGCCGFHLHEGGPELELVYHFKRAEWGRGYATEAARACLRYGFERLKAPRVVATVLPENEASCRVLEKLGFRYKGVVQYEGVDEKFYEATPPG